MKILMAGIYNPAKVMEGPEAVAYWLFKSLEGKGEIKFLTKYSQLPEVSLWDRFWGYKEVGNIIYAGFMRIPFAARTFKPDILHLVNFDIFLPILLIGKYSACKIVYTVNGIVHYENKQKRFLSAYYRLKTQILEKLIFRYSDYFVFPSGIAKSMAKRYFGIRDENTKIIPNGLHQGLKLGERTKSELNKTLKIAAYTGSLSRQKGLELFFDAVIGSELKFNLEIIGPVYHMVVPQPLRPYVSFREKVDYDKWIEVLQNTDVYLSLAYFETFSISSVEALACGCIVIVSEDTGVAEYITDGVNGFIVDVETPHKLKKVLMRMYKNPEEQIMIQNAGIKLSQKFDWVKIADEYLSVYQEVVNTQS